jgi:putative tryptophan/tyrosine transport system substrate-binding protein
MTRLDRRRFAGALAAFPMLAAPSMLRAQGAGRIFRIGVLRPTLPDPDDILQTLLPSALRDEGYVEGRNLVLVHRYADFKPDRLPVLARQLVAERVDLLFTIGSAATRAAAKETATIPIVFFGNFDPVAIGLVRSLSRPGGNTTGVLIAPDGTLAAKRMELLKQAVPGTKRIAVLLPDDPNSESQQRPEAIKAARELNVELAFVTVRNRDYADAFAKIAATRPDALFVTAASYFVRDRKPIIELARKYRLPAIYEWPEQVEQGGLMSYGQSSLAGAYRRIAQKIDKVLDGANAGEIPVEQPTTLQLVINVATARAIGLAIPQSLLLRADRLIE